MTGKVKRPFLYMLIAGITLGAGTITWSAARAHRSPQGSANATQVTNSAFRDGLFQGKLDAEQGRAKHVSASRWNSHADRASFRSGYEQGYGEVLAANGQQRH